MKRPVKFFAFRAPEEAEVQIGVTSPEKVEKVIVEGITASSLFLHWNPPKSDGGSAITDYVVEQRR